MTQHSQITGGTTYPFSYGYNAVGLTQEVYPSTRSVTLGYDGAGRVSTIGGTKSYTNSAIQYTAHGAIATLPLAVNSLTEQRCYNSRLQPFAIRLGSGPTTNCANNSDALNLLFTYGATQDGTGNVTSGDDNGNVLSQQIARAGQTTVTQSYPAYDGVNRLGSASESGGTNEWSQTYGYDAYGNRWVTGTTLSSFTPMAQSNFNSSNQLMIQGSSYDAAGNQQVIGAYSFQYDGENRQTSATVGGTVVGTYSYDAEGRRVTKVSGGTTTVYVYDALGQLTAEYSTAEPSALCQTCYLTVDHLGSTRQQTDGTSGQVVACHDYFPFGEEIPSGTGGRTAACFTAADATTQRFTGKERDNETASSAMEGLDYFGARYFSGAQGRFSTPDDPFNDQDPADPQSWNLYSYVRNSSLTYTDATGMFRSSGEGGPPGCSDPWAPCGSLFRLWWDSLQQTVQQFAQQVRSFISTPRDPGCMMAAMSAGAGVGAAAGLVGVTTGPGELVIEPAAVVGGAVHGLAGGSFVCMSNSGPSSSGGGARPQPLRGAEATKAAAKLGFTKRIPPQKAPFNSHGQAVFQKGNRFITADVDSHSGGVWKMFDRNGLRLGTYDANLVRIGN